MNGFFAVDIMTVFILETHNSSGTNLGKHFFYVR